MICPNFKNNICLLASKLCGEDVNVYNDTCNKCGGSTIQNKQTVCLAIYHLGQIKKNKLEAIKLWKKMSETIDLTNKGNISQFGVISDKNKKKLQSILEGDGVGSQLWKILEKIGINHNAGCGCLDWAERMNLWGPELCDKNRKQIIEHMKKSAKNYGWGDVARAIRKAIKNKLIYKLNPLDPFGSLLNEAIIIAVKKEPIDIIIPLGNGSKYNNIEICIALRSIEKNAIGYRRIFIIGKIPEFLIENDVVKLISLNEFNCGKEARISQKFIWAFNNLDTTDRVALWNDDYVLLQETDVRNIGNYYRGSLFRNNNKGYSKRLNATHDYLIRNKLPTLNYDCHVPIIYEKEKFLSIMNQWNDSKNNGGFTAKSIYGNNFCQNKNERIKDVKLGKGWSKQFNKILKNKRWLISYGDNALDNGLKEKLLELFPNKSSYEK